MAETDRLIRFLLPAAHTRGAIIRGSGISREAARLHGIADEPAALLGQTLIASILLLSISKGGIRQVLQLDASEPQVPVTRMLAEARSGAVRGYLSWQEEHASMRHQSGTTLRHWMGDHIRLSTVRDLGFGHPYVSTIEHDSDFLADYLVHYLGQSVQVHADIVLHGDLGLLIEAMPGCEQEHWFAAVEALAAIPDAALDGEPEQVLEHFAALGCKIVEADEYRYHCACNPEKMAYALQSMPAEQLAGLQDEQGRITVTCQYCHKQYRLPLPEEQ